MKLASVPMSGFHRFSLVPWGDLQSAHRTAQDMVCPFIVREPAERGNGHQYSQGHNGSRWRNQAREREVAAQAHWNLPANDDRNTARALLCLSGSLRPDGNEGSDRDFG